MTDPTLHGIWRLTAGFILAALALVLTYDGVIVLVWGHETSISNVLRWAFRRSPSLFALFMGGTIWLVFHVWPAE